MITLLQTKLNRHDLYEIILSVLTSRCLYMRGKGENRSFPSFPPPEIVFNLIKSTQTIFQNESSLLRLHFTKANNGNTKEDTNNTVTPINFIIVGDLHGNIDDLLRIFEDNSYPPDAKYVFTGDYVDRGTCSVEIMLLLFSLKNLYPNHIFLLRGNHESQDICSIYGFQSECERKYPNSLFKDNNIVSDSFELDNISVGPSSDQLQPSTSLKNVSNCDSTENQEVIELDSSRNSTIDDDHTNDGFNSSFLDLEINLNSINLPSLFPTSSTNVTHEDNQSTKIDVENEYFSFQNYHYNNYNDNDENYNDNTSFYCHDQNILPNKIYQAFTESFSYMPFAAVIEDQIFCVHGGISPDVSFLEQIEEIKRPCLPSDNLVSNGILWSDPRNDLPMGEGTGNGFEPSDRGTGYLYSESRLNDFLKANSLTYLIRSHEPCEEGVNKPFGDDGRCITVFSNSDYCGMENNAAIVKLTPIDSSLLPSSSSSSTLLSSSSFSSGPNVVNDNNNNDNNSVSINIENLSNQYKQNNHENINNDKYNHDNIIYNDNDNEFVKDSVYISFRYYEPLQRNELNTRRVIIPEWIFSNINPKPPINFSNVKYHYHDNDLFNSIIDEPVELFYSGI